MTPPTQETTMTTTIRANGVRYTAGTISQVTQPGHPWDGKCVVLAREHGLRDDSVECELPEEQSLPAGKRLVCGFRPENLTALSAERQEQVCAALGLRQEVMPYRS
jgi:hypothetical protein